MNVLLCLSVAVFALCPGDVTAQFIAAPPTCPGDTFTFNCTVGGDRNGVTTWRVNGSSDCPLVHRPHSSSSYCGQSNAFIARSRTGFGTNGPSFTSTLSGNATSTLNGTLVECFGPANNVDTGNRVGGSILPIIGPPSVPTLSCVDLSEDVSGAVNVTVSWTLSGGDSADFYLISITTNAPQTPYGGLLNITTAIVTWRKLTGFIADHEYNITVRGVNCGRQEGRESEPLTIRPQVPAVVSRCNITVAYDHPPERLLFINTTWDSMPDQVDPDPGEMCPSPRANITRYQIRFQANSSVIIENMSISECKAGRCNYTFKPPSNPPSSYDSVSVAAENVVGVGDAKVCTTQTISTTNNFLRGGIENMNSPGDARFFCTFLSGFTGSARCTVQYGTDLTYMNLPYSAESTETGTAGDTVNVELKERLNSLTEYYYILSAISEDITVVMRGTLITPSYSCSLMELWNLLAAGAALQHDVSLLGDAAAQYPSCDDGSIGSVVLVNTTLSTATVAYYTGNMTGSMACFVCDESSGYTLNTSTNERVCQSNVTWSGSPTVCVCNQSNLQGWNISLIVLGTLSLVVCILVTIIATYNFWKDKLKCWQIVLIVTIVTTFGVTAVALWIAVRIMVSSPPNDNVCDSSWRHSRDGWIATAFSVSSFVLILAILLVIILRLIALKRYRVVKLEPPPPRELEHPPGPVDRRTHTF